MSDKKKYEKTPFRQYYEEFCEVFGHPLWILPMFGIAFFVMVETMHTSYHMNEMQDAHGYCMQKEFVKDLVQYKEENMY